MGKEELKSIGRTTNKPRQRTENYILKMILIGSTYPEKMVDKEWLVLKIVRKWKQRA